jgi:hypothetical protein
MDVVYPLHISTWDYIEIKFSIRSLFKHSTEPIGKIFIVGQRPEFFEYSDKLIHVPFKQTQAKEINIWEKILKASKDKRVSEKFFFMNDDFFFVEDFTMSTFPTYHKGNLKTFPWTKLPIPSLTGYSKKSAITLKLLSKLKLSTWHYDIHTPAVMDKQKFKDTYNFFKPHLYKGTGLLLFSCYGNYNNWEPVERVDLKIPKKGLKQHLERELNLMFSIADDAQCPYLLDFLEKTYPDKSPVER